MPKRLVFTLMLLCQSLINQHAYALDDNSYAVGRYWGFDPIEAKEEPKPLPAPKPQSENKPSAKAVLSQLTEMIDEAKAKAVLNPNMENVKHFMVLKNKAGNMATRFSQVWQEVLLQNAHLDYSAYKPTNNQAIIVLNRKNQQRIEKVLNIAAKRYGLIYFYQGDDALAKMQAPILVRLAKKYQFEVLGVSLDGQLIEGFERNSVDSGQARKMGVQKVPALFALNPTNQEFLPLSYTLLAERELEQRLFDVFSHYEAWQ